VNIPCVQEMKWKWQKAKEGEDTGFKLWYIGNTSTKNGVGIVLNKSLKDGVVDIKHQGDRIILVKLFVGYLIFNVISAYAPQIGLNESVKMQLWEELDALVSSVPIS
jgi:exonuclease III